MIFKFARTIRAERKNRKLVEAKLARMDQLDAATRMFQDAVAGLPTQCALTLMQDYIKHSGATYDDLRSFNEWVSRRTQKLYREAV